ncbi:MAG: carboxypeptidase-like regulatory domain-containing protein [Williamsia sp.]|nr:carboxypeptidase-like regulatory domain-containing protein [Williamsia sp.]
MSKEIYLHVKEPCHENWNAMSPVQQGRFCQSCAKQVVDFSRMSDSQILDVLSKAAGNTCGRFMHDQLERPMVKEPKEISYFVKPYKIALSSLVPLLIVSVSAACQDKEVMGKPAIAREAPPVPKLMGDVVVVKSSAIMIQGRVLSENGIAIKEATILLKGTKTSALSDNAGSFSLSPKIANQTSKLQISCIGYETQEIEVNSNHTDPVIVKLKPEEIVVLGYGTIKARHVKVVKPPEFQDAKPKEVTIKGRVVDKNREPLPYATIAIKDLDKVLIADSEGNFSFSTESGNKELSLSASHTGYEQTCTKIGLHQNEPINVQLALESKRGLDTVTVTGYPVNTLVGRVGAYSVVETVTRIDTLNTFVQKLLRNELFKVFPNPVAKRQNLHLYFRSEGDYAIQLFDNAGRLYFEKQVKQAGKNPDFLLPVPATMGSGVYYLKAINTTSNKKFIEKIIVP